MAFSWMRRERRVSKFSVCIINLLLSGRCYRPEILRRLLVHLFLSFGTIISLLLHKKEQAKREQARRGTPKINTGLEGIHKKLIQAID